MGGPFDSGRDSVALPAPGGGGEPFSPFRGGSWCHLTGPQIYEVAHPWGGFQVSTFSGSLGEFRGLSTARRTAELRRAREFEMPSSADLGAGRGGKGKPLRLSFLKSQFAWLSLGNMFSHLCLLWFGFGHPNPLSCTKPMFAPLPTSSRESSFIFRVRTFFSRNPGDASWLEGSRWAPGRSTSAKGLRGAFGLGASGGTWPWVQVPNRLAPSEHPNPTTKMD